MVDGSADLKGIFTVKQWYANLKGVFQRKTIWAGTPQNLLAEFIIRYETEDLYAKFETVATASLKGIFTVKQWQEDLYAKFEVRHSSSNTIYARFETQAIKDLYAKFEAQAIKDLYAKFEVTHSENLYAKFETVATAQLKGIVTVRHPDSEALRGEFRVTAEGWEMQGLTAAVYRDLSVIS